MQINNNSYFKTMTNNKKTTSFGSAKFNPYDSLTLFIQEAKKHKLLTREDEVRLGGQIKLGGKEGLAAWRKMFDSNLRLLLNLSNKFNNIIPDVERMDFISRGVFGLMEAIDQFDPDLGFKFSTFATGKIQKYMRLESHEHSRTIRIPTNISNKESRVIKTTDQLSQKLGRVPNQNEIIQHLKTDSGYSSKDVVEGLNVKVESLDTPDLAIYKELSDDNDEFMTNIALQDKITPSPDKILQSLVAKKIINSVLQGLEPREQEVITKRFGLVDGKEFPLKDIAEELGLSKERIRQIEVKTLQKLSKGKNARKLRECVDFD